MNTSRSQVERVLDLARQKGVISATDLKEAALPQEYLPKLAQAGHLTQLAPGVYMDVDADIGEQVELVVVAKRVPRAIFFGLTALAFHGLTTQVAHEVAFALERDTWTPRLAWPTIEVVHLSGPAFSTGIETHLLQGHVPARVYSVAKTLADLFKFRTRFGLDLAIEALREGWQQHRFRLDELDQCARACRVRGVMQPYMEMLT